MGNLHLLLLMPAFTSDHIETLFELDLEYGHMAKEVIRVSKGLGLGNRMVCVPVICTHTF